MICSRQRDSLAAVPGIQQHIKNNNNYISTIYIYDMYQATRFSLSSRLMRTRARELTHAIARHPYTRRRNATLRYNTVSIWAASLLYIYIN